jgi:signal transduction histidine kinase
MNHTDDELIQELATRFAQSRKAFSDLVVVNRKLVEMNRRLEQSEAIKSNFLSNIRNEINNPLNAIIGLSDQLSSPSGLSDDVIRQLATLIHSEASILDFQLRNIFLAAELEAGEVDPHIVRVAIPALIEDVTATFRHNAAKKSVTITTILPDAVPPCHTDAEKVQVILSNLLANAVEFSPPDDDVEIRLSTSADGWLMISVRDHGPGIAEEDQKVIFDRFVQLETGTTRSHMGHGLGLSVSRSLVELLQGAISVQSSPGQGALFSITLPLSPIADDGMICAEGGNLFLFESMDEK